MTRRSVTILLDGGRRVSSTLKIIERDPKCPATRFSAVFAFSHMLLFRAASRNWWPLYVNRMGFQDRPRSRNPAS